jgi:hypothetical protein
MKKYLLILFCSLAFGQASNQMVTFTQAQSLGFALNAGQSSVNSNECLTKAQALAKYNLNAGSMSAYASNQLVPRSVWATGGDITLPLGADANVDWNSIRTNTATITWSGASDNVGVTGYKIFMNGSLLANVGLINSYALTGLSALTGYSLAVRAIDAAGNTSTSGMQVGFTTAINPPTNLNNSVSNSSSVYLWWTPSTGPFPSGGTATNQYVYLNGNLHATIPGNVNNYTVTGLAASTTYNFMVRAAGINGSSGSFSNDSNTTSGTTFADITYEPNYYYKTNPCFSQQLYDGSDGKLYWYNNGYELYAGYVYSYVGPSQDVYNWFDWEVRYLYEGVFEPYYGTTISPCGLY